MSLRICHISNHPYEHDEARDGCVCTVRFDNYEMPETPLFGIVPGGTHPEAERKAYSQQFNRDMHAYREAVRAGAEPDQVTQEAVYDWEREQYAMERVVTDGEVLEING